MIRGIPLEVSGYIGKTRDLVADIVPIIGGNSGPKAEDWKKKENGIRSYNQLAPGGHMIQLMGKLPSGELVYSEALPFTAEAGKSCQFKLEMKPGIRLEGRLDDNVPRPVKNGRVIIAVRPKEYPATAVPEELGDLHGKYGAFHFWTSYRPIAEDGTFIFESIPAGEVDVIVHGDGFVSKRGAIPRNRGRLAKDIHFGVPQDFPLIAPVTAIQIVTEATATLEVKARTKWGRPIPNIAIYINPNLLRIRTGLFGMIPTVCDEALLRTIPSVPQLNWAFSTDKDGIAVLRNVPSFENDLSVWDDEYEIPFEGDHGMVDRSFRYQLEPGKTEKVSLTLQRKGKQFIGDVK